MPDYQNNRFKKPSFSRGGDRRDSRPMGGPTKLYKAECSNCHKECEVPFRPNGMKPVFCRDCFNTDRGDDRGSDRGERPSFQKREYGPKREFTPRAAAPAADPRIDGLARQLSNLEAKLDNLAALIEDMTIVPEPKTEKAAPKKRATKKA